MSPDEATLAVHEGQRAIAMTGQGDVHSEGKVIAYSIHPQVLLVMDDGRTLWWRADLVTPAPATRDLPETSED